MTVFGPWVYTTLFTFDEVMSKLITGDYMNEKRDELLDELKAEFPHGHPEFLPMLLEKMKLHSDKNHDYARGGNPLGNFERVAKILGQYPGLDLSDPVVVMLVYALKQVDATLWGLSQKIEQKVEGPIERLGDVLVYAGIAICALKDRAKKLFAPDVTDTKAVPGYQRRADGTYLRATPQDAAREPRHRGTPLGLPLLSEMPVPTQEEIDAITKDADDGKGGGLTRRHPFDFSTRHPRVR
jgi:hypothetical protein